MMMATTMTMMTNDSNSNKQSNVVLRSQCNEILFSGSHNDDGMIYEYEKEKKVRTIVGEILEDIISSISILPSSLPSLPSLPSLQSSFPSPVVGSDDDDDENDNDVIIREGNNSTSNSYSTPLKEVQFTESFHREYCSNNRDVVLFGVNTIRKDNSNLKEIIKCNYERFYYQAKTIQERILIVEQIVIAVLSSNGRFIKLHRRRCRDNNNDDSNNNVGDNAGGGDCSIGKEVHVVDFNTARDRIIQIFQLTKERHQKKKKQQQQIAYNQVVNRTRTKDDDVSNGVISTGRDDNGTDNGTWQQQVKNSHSNGNSSSDSKSHNNSSNDNDESIIKNRLAQAVQDTITLERNGRFLRKLSAIFLPNQPKKEVHEISSNSSSIIDLNKKNHHNHMNTNGGVQGGGRRVPHYQGLLKQHQERQIRELQDLSRSRISQLRISVGMAGGLRGGMGSLLGGTDSNDGITGTCIDSSGTNNTTPPVGIDPSSMTHAALMGKIGGTIGALPPNNSNSNSSNNLDNGSTIMTMTDGMMNNADMMKMNGGLINSNSAVTRLSSLGGSTVTTNPIKIMEGPLNGTNHWASRPMMVGGNVSPPSLRQVSTLIDLPRSKRILPFDTLR
jgi:hypothetical protein